MTQPQAQQRYQLRLGWAEHALEQLAESDIVIVVDAIPSGDAAAEALAAAAQQTLHTPSVYLASLRNAAATARACVAQQLRREGRTSINLVLCGDGGSFAVEDYLAAGAIAEALTELGIDHSSPEVAVALEGYRSLKRAVKHLFSASEAGQQLAHRGLAAAVHSASMHDAEEAAERYLPDQGRAGRLGI